MDLAITTRNLSKHFEPPQGWRMLTRGKGTTAVEGVNLEVRPGEVFGLLGPNGAGKTTLVKVLCTLILPSSGAATVAGYPLSQSAKIRESVGLVVSDERSFYWRLTGRQNLRFFAAMYRLNSHAAEERIEQVLEDVDMLSQADTSVRNYSTGMKQRLAIARSLLHRPSILFLDEPSRNLDPTATSRLHQMILDLNAHQRVTIFLITHDLAEAQKLCQRVAVMHHGRIQAVGQPAELRRELQPIHRYAVLVDDLYRPAETSIRQLAPDLQCEKLQGRTRLLFQAKESDGNLTAILDCLRQYRVNVYSIEGRSPGLEEVFAQHTGGE